MLPWFFRALALLVVIAAAGNSAVAQSSGSADQLFRGKTITLVVPTGPGGGYSVYALLLARYLGRHLPGAPTIVPEYRAGAGGVIAANYLFSVAPHDGTVIGMPLSPIILGQYTGGSAVEYNAAKFRWIGQMDGLTRVLAVWGSSKIKRFEDLKTYPSIAGTTGKGSETFINPAIINHVFGTKIKIVAGYKGSSTLLLALERGEIDLMSATWNNIASTHDDWVKQGAIKFLVQIGLSKLPNLPDLPQLSDLAPNEQDRQLIEFMSLVTTSVGYSLMAPPGVPDNIIAALRRGFDETMKDPGFVADAEKRHLELAPADYRLLEQSAQKAINSPPALFQRFMRALGGS